jgi:LysR family carnitine catabolism transcriptional activator
MYISDHVLKSFLTLAETGQFTVAAEQCHMTQSALSQMISKLEERVGVPLFHRDTRSVTLTAEGKRLSETARRVILDIDQMMNDLRDVATLQTGYVALAVVPSLAVMWLPKILGLYRAAHPRVRVELHDVSSVRCLELVRQGLVEFALNSQPGTPHEVEANLLFEEALYVVCPLGHPLASVNEVTPRMLAKVKFLHLQGTGNMLVRTGKSFKPARQVFQEAGIEDTGFDVNNLATLAGLVAAGLGVCLSPETSLPNFKLLPTVAVRISPKMMTRPIYLIHRKNRELSPAAKKLQKMLIDNPHLGLKPLSHQA